MMCRYRGDGGEAVAYLDLQNHLESRKPLGMESLGAATLQKLKGFLTL